MECPRAGPRDRPPCIAITACYNLGCALCDDILCDVHYVSVTMYEVLMWLHVPGRYVCVVPRGDNVRPLRPFFECCVRTLCPCAHILHNDWSQFVLLSTQVWVVMRWYCATWGTAPGCNGMRDRGDLVFSSASCWLRPACASLSPVS